MDLAGNQILDRLPKDVRDRLGPDFELVEVPLHKILHHPGEDIHLLYFPLNCMISVTITMGDGRIVETGAIGSREVVGINAFMGGRETTQTQYIGQIGGRALKIAAAPVKDEFDRNTEFRTLLLSFTQAFIAQISQNVGCNRMHQNDARCARWMLEVRDRVRSDSFVLTQEFISQMLGANRTTLSQSMSALKEAGLIDYSRGRLDILDVQGLETRSCECFALLQKEYLRLLGPVQTHI